jgi:hypothetical protein
MAVAPAHQTKSGLVGAYGGREVAGERLMPNDRPPQIRFLGNFFRLLWCGLSEGGLKRPDVLEERWQKSYLLRHRYVELSSLIAQTDNAQLHSFFEAYGGGTRDLLVSGA